VWARSARSISRALSKSCDTTSLRCLDVRASVTVARPLAYDAIVPSNSVGRSVRERRVEPSFDAGKDGRRPGRSSVVLPVRRLDDVVEDGCCAALSADVLGSESAGRGDKEFSRSMRIREKVRITDLDRPIEPRNVGCEIRCHCTNCRL